MLFRLLCVEPGLILLPDNMTSDEARVMLLAIAGVESNWTARKQIPGGQALGKWQFQQDGTAGVLEKVPALARQVLDTCDVPVSEAWQAIEYNDAVACAFARLLLWSDPAALPVVGDKSGAWAYYRRLWKPGRPDAKRWLTSYATAVSVVEAA
jgi:hypothetical protein